MATSKGSYSVGVLGVGKMGSAIAERLIVSGHYVTVWNRTPSKAAPLKAVGAAVASSPADLAEAADLVIANLTDHASTLAVLESEDTAAALRGKTLVQTAMTTSSEASWISPLRINELGAVDEIDDMF